MAIHLEQILKTIILTNIYTAHFKMALSPIFLLLECFINLFALVENFVFYSLSSNFSFQFFIENVLGNSIWKSKN